jgi:hypothetical protein
VHCKLLESTLAILTLNRIKPLGIAGTVAGVAAAASAATAPITVPAVFVGILVIGWLHEVNAQAFVSVNVNKSSLTIYLDRSFLLE